MEDHASNSDETREPYEAPTIEDVPLRPEEQLLAGCKLPAGGGVGTFFGCQGPSSCVHPNRS